MPAKSDAKATRKAPAGASESARRPSRAGLTRERRAAIASITLSLRREIPADDRLETPKAAFIGRAAPGRSIPRGDESDRGTCTRDGPRLSARARARCTERLLRQRAERRPA